VSNTRSKSRNSKSAPSNPLSGRLAEKREQDENDAAAIEALRAEVEAESAELSADLSAGNTETVLSDPAQAEDKAEVEELRKIVADLQARVESNEAATAGDDDHLLFLARARGQNWSERHVRDNKYVEVGFTATRFFGPFQDREAVDAYLKAKNARPEGELEWSDVKVVDGAERNAIRRQERSTLESQGSREAFERI